ncbi:MAG: cell division protein FtsL [Pseudomonadota bacterium]
MRSIIYLLSVVGVIGLAVWAYQQNYATQGALREVESLNRQIAEERERLAVLRAEWAYLNRPERLSELAFMNFESLGLLPFTPDRFGDIKDISEYETAMPQHLVGVQTTERAEAGQ